MANALQRDGYDYESLPTNVAKEAKSVAARIQKRCKRMLKDACDNGSDLIQVKKQLIHGEFGKWIRAEFCWSRKTAERQMNLATHFGGKLDSLSNLEPQPTIEAMYFLSAESISDAARDKAIELIQDGVLLDLPKAKETAATYGGYQYPEVSSAKRWEAFIKWIEKFAEEESAKVAVARLRELADKIEARCEN